MKLTILATSDIHGYLYPTDYINDKENLPIGLLKAATIIEQERNKAEGPVLLVENGDYIQGSPLSQYIEENKETPKQLVSVLNDINYDVGVIGNHEFNYGLDYLKKGIKAANHPILSANILENNDHYLADEPAKIIERDGVKLLY